MLCKGFGPPQHSISVFHNLRQRLALKLRMVGGFTRVRFDLSDPVLLADIAGESLRDEF